MSFLKNLYRFLSPRFQTLFLEYPVQFQPRHGHGKPPHDLLYKIISAERAHYAEILRGFLQHKAAIQNIKKQSAETDPAQPSWNNGFLPGLDTVAIYGMLAHFRPQQYVEIGSGYSTKVARKSVIDNHLGTRIISIDPHPRAEIDRLADTVIRLPLEAIDFSFLKNMAAGDILFIDNSHRVLPNSDATVFFMEVLPYLPKGVIVHIHDIYLPYDYPQFMCDRFYSEQYVLAAFVLANPDRYKPLLPNYFISEDKPLSKLIADIWQHPNLEGVEQHGGSFWLQIN
jgi:hypothetical protein